MTQEDKDLLLIDLCARLPYGVKGNYLNSNDVLLRKVTIIYSYLEPNGMVMTGDIKPYLFPLSSMTEEQKKECQSLIIQDAFGMSATKFTLQDFYNKYHFDHRGLIPMGLAEDATGKNVYQ